MTIRTTAGLGLALALGATIGCGRAGSGDLADAIYVNANVITVNDAQPRAEAIAVKDGKILAVGTRRDIERYRGDSTAVHDLGGKTVTPGFIDAHGHLSGAGIVGVAANLLPPPDGKVTSIAKLQQSLRAWMDTSVVPKTYGVIFGAGYDDSQLKEQRHPTRDELDAVSTEYPIIAMHQSGHLSVLNSRALRLVGYAAATPDPDGGVIRRRPGSREPNGVLEENAHSVALGKIILSKLGPEQALATTMAGLEEYASFGYTTAQDGGMTPALAAGYIAAGKQGKLPLDVVGYMAYPMDSAARAYMQGEYVSRDYHERFRIGGVKIMLDGSPQGKTAWLTQPYVEPPAGQDAGYRGYPNMPDERLEGYVEESYRNGWQVLAHVNGDAALDQYLDAIEKARARMPGTDRRTVAIHAQTARADQLDRMKSLEVTPSFFAAHTYYWGDWHRNSVLGPERAANISPTRWALDRGMIFTTHHDAPVIPPKAMRIFWATVNRTTRSGLVLGPEQRVSADIALKALTIWAAYQHFEEDLKGSIEPGKLADLVVLSGDPLTIDPAGIADIQVLETIKEGRTVYRRGP